MSHLSATIGVLATLAQTLTVPVAPQSTVASPTPPPAVQSSSSVRAETRESLPRVVCGMVVVPADAAVDPPMIKPAPSDVHYSMPVIVPPLCVD